MYKKILIIFLLSIISVTGCQNSENDKVDQQLQASMGDDKAPAFSLKSTDNKDISLADYKGKVIIIDFWATWCPPCRKGIPDLIAIQNEFKDDVVIIGISLDRDTKNDVVPFVKNYGINYPVVFGNEDVANKFGGIQAIPTSFIIDKKGNIVDKHVGLVDKSVYTDKIKSLLGKS